MKLAFIHVPRTGGMAVQQALHGRLGPYVRWYDARKFPPSAYYKLIIEDNDIQWLGGHYCWQHCSGVKYVIMLRNPVERILSYFWQGITYKPETESFDAKLMDCVLAYPNVTTRMLAGGVEDLDLAVERLKACRLVGIFPHVQTFVDKASKLLSISTPPVRWLNVGPEERPETPTSIITEIEKSNWADIELWKIGKKLW